MRYAEAKQIYDQKQYEDALIAFIEFFEYYKNNSRALYYIADCYFNLQKYDEALEYVVPYVDNQKICHNQMSGIICKIIKSSFEINKEEHKLKLAELLLELWVKSDEKEIQYLSTYGVLSRKMGCAEKYINILDELENKNILQDEYSKNAKLWCLYDCYIKTFNISDATENHEIEGFIERANYIIDNCEQKELINYHVNPYVFTIIKVVKILNTRSSINYGDIICWLMKLDVKELPNDNEGSFIAKNEKEYQYASSREFYYYQLARAYEKTDKYTECINICDQALQDDIQFHYRNRLWLTARKLYCECIVAEDKEAAIREYKKMADKNNYWYMQHKLANIYFRNNQMKEALIYGCKALDITQEDKKLINVILDLSYFFEANNDISAAKVFLQNAIAIKRKYHWQVDWGLQCRLRQYGLDEIGTIRVNDLKRICRRVLEVQPKEERYIGEIVKYTKNGYSGFIKQRQGENIFFNKSEIKSKMTLQIGSKVSYDISENKQGLVAKNIIMLEGE